MPAIINSDDGVLSGSSGLKTSGGNDGITAFQQNGTESVRITAAGNVGIGTSSPSSRLHSDATGGAPSSTATTTASRASLQLSSTVGLGTNTRFFAGVGSSDYVWIQAQNASDNSFRDVVINSLGGNVGIGTSSPGTRLQVQMPTSGTGVNFRSTGGTNNPGLFFSTNESTTVSQIDASGSTSGILALATSGVERFRIAGDGAFSAVIPSGSTLYPSFFARAWVNFNGQGTVAIRASGNVTSITDNNVGDYTVNFTNAMPDANYCVVGMSSANIQSGTNPVNLLPGVSIINDPNAYQSKTTGQVRLFNDSTTDTFDTNVAIFR